MHSALATSTIRRQASELLTQELRTYINLLSEVNADGYGWPTLFRYVAVYRAEFHRRMTEAA